jgi:uncharacterized membrane protein
MDEKTQAMQAPPTADGLPFHAVLTAHRSLSPRGFLIVLGLLSLVSFVTGVVFALKGAWPVLGFFGLDVLLVYVAFKVNYRAARAFETIDVTPDLLAVTQIDPRGRARRFEFNPYWVRVLLRESPDGRTDLRLALHGRELSCARLLTDDERRDFAVALRTVLADARSRHAGTGYSHV